MKTVVNPDALNKIIDEIIQKYVRRTTHDKFG